MIKGKERKYFNTISEFKFIQKRHLGKGSFGQVRLALHTLTNKLYAIKIVETKYLTTQVSNKAIKNQISVHSSIYHPHIIQMWQVFQQGSKVYMIMEYAQKGNLFFYQNQKKIFTQREASIFFSQVLSALQYLHSLNLVHRDIKPENLLLDKDLNIKICDLGWVTEGINQNHTTFCGTYQYMAPQMIFDRSYDHKVDIWAIGILLYELLHGYAPFEGQKIQQVRESMIKGQIYFDSQLSDNVQNLIFNILKVNPSERLKIQQIKNHPWLIQMNRKRLLNQQLQTNKISSQKDQIQQNKNKIKANQIKFCLKMMPQKKEQLKKILSTRTIMIDRRKKKNLRLKSNISIENINQLTKQTTQKEQNKQNYSKIMRNSSKKQGKKHQIVFSDLSQMLLSHSKLNKQGDNKKLQKRQKFRYKTQNDQGIEHFKTHSGLKKKKIQQKKLSGLIRQYPNNKITNKFQQKVRVSID